MEREGFTKEGFIRILQRNMLQGITTGKIYELVAGDGLVGSLGLWLEQDGGWRVEAWEHRPWPLASFEKNRPSTKIYDGRLTRWSVAGFEPPLGITTRGAREAVGVCRAIRDGSIRPRFVGIWNPSRRSVWSQRLQRVGYRLELVYERMEFYKLK